MSAPARPRTGRLLSTGAPVVITGIGVWLLTEAAAPWWACVAVVVIAAGPAVVTWWVTNRRERTHGR